MTPFLKMSENVEKNYDQKAFPCLYNVPSFFRFKESFRTFFFNFYIEKTHA